MGELAALMSAMTWSATSVALTALSARTAPAVLSGLRLAVGSLFLLALLVSVGQVSDVRDVSAVTLLGIVGSGFIGYGLGDTTYIRALALLGMQRTFPISMSLYIGLTVIGGVILLGEPFTWGLPAGAALIAAGIYLVVVPSKSQDDIPLPILAAAEPALSNLADLPPAEHDAVLHPAVRNGFGWQGYALLLGVGVFWATATLWLAGTKGELPAIATAAIRAPAGAMVLLVFAATTQFQNLATPFRRRGHIGAIVAAGFAGTAFGSLLYVYAVVTAGAARTAVLSATSPLMALPLSIIFLGEKFTRRIGAGTLLCVAGIILVVA